MATALQGVVAVKKNTAFVEHLFQGVACWEVDEHGAMLSLIDHHAAGCDCRGAPLLDRLAEVLQASRSATGNQGNTDSAGDALDQGEVKPSIVPSRSMEVSRISPAPRPSSSTA